MTRVLFFLLTIVTIGYAQAQDVTFTTQNIAGGGGNIGVVDMNGDYLDDILIPSASNLNIFYQTDGNFNSTNISVSATHGPSWSVSVADYDANGINDIMFGGGSGVSFLRANGDGSSFSRGYTSGIFIFSQRTNFIDINNDGHLDAFVCHDVDANVYFLNNGRGEFTDEIQGGLGDTPGGGNYGSLWFDYDNDGDMDLYLSKCKVGSTNPADPGRVNQLHRNNGDGTFTDVAASAGLALNVQSWSSAVGDFDNDGDMDLVIADQHVNEIGTKLMVNNGDGTFTDQTINSGFEDLDGAIEIVTFDFNNDGYLDIYSTLGDELLINNGDLTFTPNASSISGRGAVGDLNNDGFLDIYVGGTVLFNDGNDNNWFKLNLQGVESNINGIGAKITIEGEFGRQTRHVRSGEGFWNMHSLNPHFGLGTARSIETLTIEWPSGIVDVFNDVSSNQTLFVRENEGVELVHTESVSFTAQEIDATADGAIGVVDLNGDYLDDLLVPSEDNLNIFHQTSNSFDEVNIAFSTPAGPDRSVSAGDYDDNGINDIMFGGEHRVSFLQANADGSDFSPGYSSQIFIFSQRTNFVDINNDGHLDAFVCNEIDANVYFLNNGSGRFTNEIRGGIGDTPPGSNRGSLWFDYDDDGDLDLYLSKSNDASEADRINQLQRNNGDGTFTNVAASAGLDLNVQSWSTAVGDFDNDGDMDLIVADQERSGAGTRLMINNGNGTFTDETFNSGLDRQDEAVEIVTFDFNNDGFLDIYSALDDHLLFNNGDLTFTRNALSVEEAGAVGDLNNDGFLDIFTGSTIHYNEGNENNWVKLNLQGVRSNANGIGARIVIEGGFGQQVREVRSGEGFGNMHTLNPHFGLGAFSSIETVTVEWPSGIVDTFTDIAANQTLFVQEGATGGVVTSIDENELNNVVSIYPVPTDGILHIEKRGDISFNSKATIYTISGQATEVVIVEDKVDVKNYQAGIYVIEITDSNGKKIRERWIKQ